ncbi:hypothetical protein OAE25_00585 [Verrucomicrobiales bacterium]|nr:hypothetical protein [Schleiferiaceae bacterium]MDB4617141.1 hypothetical protein [Verrucomicrobiales bacterium]|tara:strand:+ start:321 stop:584 length:264 start_codon:yes stop_codon:yes gene_type:complete
MALSKQSIRQGVHVLVDGEHATKEELITLSETWTEKKELFFRKMLQQGGNFRMDGKEFVVKIREHLQLRSDGTKDGGVVTIPGGRSF